MPILKLKDHDPEKELEFELKHQASLTLEERFEMIRSASQWLLQKQIENGQKKATEIVKRSAR